MELKHLEELFKLVRGKKLCKLVVAAAQDKYVLEAVHKACKEDIIEPILIGNKEQIDGLLAELNIRTGSYEVINQIDQVKACDMAVSLIREGKAGIIMKGLVSTAIFLKSILNKESGIKKREVLSHFAFIEVPGYHKLLGVTDAGMNINPTLEEKVNIIQNAVEVFHRLGHKEPKVAIIGPVEVVNPKIESTLHAAMLALMNHRNQITGCKIDGPLALDMAVSDEAAKLKGHISEVAGDADILIAPDLNSGNILYKSLIFLAGGTSAAIIMGAKSPVVLTSRADSESSKHMSILLAAAMDQK